MAEAVDRATEIQTEISDPSQETDKPSSEGLIEEQVAQNVEEVDYQPDCPVCLQSSFYPVKLPCGHIFCFLCIKGVVLRSRRCALCRHSVAVDYLDNPTLIKVGDKIVRDKEALKSEEKQVDGSQVQEFVWYYEGRNGWWTYDEKTSADVEKAFKNGQRSCTLLIAGFLYVIDFENMFQMRKNEPGRRRRIKRDKRDVDSKGVAGIRVPPSSRPTAVLNRTADSSSTDKANNTENQSEVEHATTGVSDEIHSPTDQNVGDSEADTGVEEIVSRISDEPNSKE